jgi:hypothetical protein
MAAGKRQLIPMTTVLLCALSLSFAVYSGRPSTFSKPMTSKCPVVTVSCPTADQPFRFTAGVFDADSSEKISNVYLEYCWTLSKGKIAFGQGTDSITVDGSSTDIRAVTATVDVRGLDSDCKTKASCSTSSR